MDDSNYTGPTGPLRKKLDRGVLIWGAIVMTVAVAMAIYSIVRPNRSPLSPQERDIMDAGPGPANPDFPVMAPVPSR